MVCFVGDARVSVASVILDPHDQTSEQLRPKLDLLRRNVPQSGVSERPVRAQFGFAVTCCSRGQRFWGRAGVETEAFAELFPGVPLAGFFGGGEFGHNVLPKTDPRVGKHGTRTARPTSHGANAGNINNMPGEFGFTTVIAIISVFD